MGKSEVKKYVIISGLDLNDNNRGTAALGYGSFHFLQEKHQMNGLIAIRLIVYKKPWKFNFKSKKEMHFEIGKDKIVFLYIYVCFFDYWIYKHLPFFAQLTKTSKILEKVSFVAAINGGDGFSDIYGSEIFHNRLFDIDLAMRENIPLILLPQTIGPFRDVPNLKRAEIILKYASKVYVRDLKFETELKSMNVTFELTNDLSYYMYPQKTDIEIKPNAVGINVSGLCFSNRFSGLAGCFNNYPQLIMYIIKNFQEKNVPIYLLAHSYNYENPEYANDDMQTAKDVYVKLDSKANVYLIDRDLTSPQTKYVISQFDFFVGTRMHANFAAIYTNVPVFGLAYSYKYAGSFSRYALENNYEMILNIAEKDISQIIDKIMFCYENRYQTKQNMNIVLKSKNYSLK